GQDDLRRGARREGEADGEDAGRDRAPGHGSSGFFPVTSLPRPPLAMAGAIGEVAVAEVAWTRGQPARQLVPEPPDLLEHLVAIHGILEALADHQREAGAPQVDGLGAHPFEERVVFARAMAVLADDEEIEPVVLAEVRPHVVVAGLARTRAVQHHRGIRVGLARRMWRPSRGWP